MRLKHPHSFGSSVRVDVLVDARPVYDSFHQRNWTVVRHHCLAAKPVIEVVDVSDDGGKRNDLRAYAPFSARDDKGQKQLHRYAA